jgi:hypothetical protein
VSDNREPPPPRHLIPRWAQSRTSRVVIGCLVLVLVWVISLPLVIFLADSSVRSSHQSDFPDFSTVPEPTYDPIEFGTGGAGCTLATTATTFSTRDRIRLVAASVPGGEEASILLLQGDAGRLVAGYPVTRLSDQTADCVDDVLPPLPADHYSVEISIPPGSLIVPRFMGTFNVTP